MLIGRMSTFLVLLTCCAALLGPLLERVSYAEDGAPVWLGHVVPDRTIHVDNGTSASSDNNSGTSDFPLRSIAAAANLAQRNRKAGLSSRIVIAAGIYREQITLKPDIHRGNVPIVFEASEPGKVIISGSDIWTEWQPKQGHIYVHSWPFEWGLAPYPPGWQDHVKLAPIVRRREMVFIDGKSLDQRLSFSDLSERSFFVSESTQELFIAVPINTHMSSARVEVAIRSGLFTATSSDNIVLRGLVFQHDATPVQGGAVIITNSRNILIEDCILRWNSWTGLSFNNVQHATVRRTRLNENGGAGWTAWRVKGLLSEENETSFNNWRGQKGGFLGWGVAGVKHLQIHDATYRRHVAVKNNTRGLWLDFDNSNILLEEVCVRGNLGDGIDIEASQGPISIKRSQIGYNKGSGIFSTNSRYVTIEDSLFQQNGTSEIRIVGSAEREVTNWETKTRLALQAGHWTVRRSLFDGSSSGLLLETGSWPHFFESLIFYQNTWAGSVLEKPFKVESSRLPFPEWRKLVGQEDNTHFSKNGFDPHQVSSVSCTEP